MDTWGYNRYQKLVDAILSLATGSLILPTIFFREFLGVPKNQPLLNLLNWKIWMAWSFLTGSIILCFIYYYASAKWIKQAYGKELKFTSITITNKFVERVLDVSFFLLFIFFIFGIAVLLYFLLSFKPSG